MVCWTAAGARREVCRPDTLVSLAAESAGSSVCCSPDRSWRSVAGSAPWARLERGLCVAGCVEDGALSATGGAIDSNAAGQNSQRDEQQNRDQGEVRFVEIGKSGEQDLARGRVQRLPRNPGRCPSLELTNASAKG